MNAVNINVNVHPSAVIDIGAKIGQGSRIWHFTHVCAGAKIGKNVSIGQGEQELISGLNANVAAVSVNAI